MGKVSQEMRILQYLYDRGSITPLDALREFGCMRLASRINELRDRLRGSGTFIETCWEENTNRYGDKIRYARYFLRREHEHNRQQ